MQTKKVAIKIAKTAINALIYLFIAVCILGVALTLTAKRGGDGAMTILGKQMRTVLTPSMEKCDQTDVSAFEIKDIRVGAMVFIDVVPDDPAEAEKWYADLKVGDVLTFKYAYVKQETITHRITEIAPKTGGGYLIRLEGDNKNSDSDVLEQVIDTSQTNSPNYVIGKVFAQNYLFGKFVGMLQSPAAIVIVVIFPSLIIVALEVIRIIRVLGEDKKKQEHAEKKSQENELDELRRRLAELEKLQSAASAPAPTPAPAPDAVASKPAAPVADAPAQAVAIEQAPPAPAQEALPNNGTSGEQSP